MSFDKDAEFKEYLKLQNYSSGYHQQIKSYYQRYLVARTFPTPVALEKHINTISKGRQHVKKAARAYLNFCEKYEIISLEKIEKYRKVLKLPTQNVDVYVPSDEEVQEAYLKVCEKLALELVFLILSTSDMLIVECYLSSKRTIESDSRSMMALPRTL